MRLNITCVQNPRFLLHVVLEKFDVFFQKSERAANFMCNHRRSDFCYSIKAVKNYLKQFNHTEILFLKEYYIIITSQLLFRLPLLP